MQLLGLSTHRRELGLHHGRDATVLDVRESPGPALLARAPARGPDGWPMEVGPGAEAMLSPGDLLVLLERTCYAVRNDGGAPTRGLAQTGAGLAGPAAGVLHARPDGLLVRPLVGGRTTPLPPDPANVALGRATLAPGAAIATHQLAGPVLLHVESGSLGLEIRNGEAWVTRGSRRPSGDIESGRLAAEDGALLRPGTAAALRNVGDGPLVVLVLTITPATGPAAPSSWASGKRGAAGISSPAALATAERSRSTVRTVSWLTPKSAARSRRLRLPALARTAASCSAESLRRRGEWYGARWDRPLTRRGGASAMTTTLSGK